MMETEHDLADPTECQVGNLGMIVLRFDLRGRHRAS